MSTSRRRGSSVTRFIAEAGNPAAKAKRRAAELNVNGENNHFIVSNKDKSKKYVLKVEDKGLKFIERPEGADKHNVEKIHAALKEATLYPYVRIASFIFNQALNDFAFEFYPLPASAPAPTKKKGKKGEESAPADDPKPQTFEFKTPLVMELKKEIYKNIEELKRLTMSAPRDEPKEDDKPKEAEEPKRKRGKSKSAADKDEVNTGANENGEKKEENNENDNAEEKPKDNEEKAAPRQRKQRSQSTSVKKSSVTKDENAEDAAPKQRKARSQSASAGKKPAVSKDV